MNDFGAKFGIILELILSPLMMSTYLPFPKVYIQMKNLWVRIWDMEIPLFDFSAFIHGGHFENGPAGKSIPRFIC